MQLRTLTTAAALAALAAPAAAGAHVTVQPTEAPAGGFARMDVRVPNERDDAGTTRVAVKMPPGIYFASYEPKPGWTVEIERRRLDRPVEVFGEEQTEEVDTVTFRGDGERGIVRPGQFLDFGLSVNVPEGRAGTKLEFPATQTYEGGEVVRWIGPEESEEPAPLVTLTAAEGEAAPTSAVASSSPAAAVTQAEVDEKASQGLAIGGLVVGALGLLAAVAAIALSRRRTTA